jgi:hypothetical protein
MCSGFEAGSRSRLIDCVHHSTLCLRVIKKTEKKKTVPILKTALSCHAKRVAEKV